MTHNRFLMPKPVFLHDCNRNAHNNVIEPLYTLDTLAHTPFWGCAKFGDAIYRPSRTALGATRARGKIWRYRAEAAQTSAADARRNSLRGNMLTWCITPLYTSVAMEPLRHGHASAPDRTRPQTSQSSCYRAVLCGCIGSYGGIGCAVLSRVCRLA